MGRARLLLLSFAFLFLSVVGCARRMQPAGGGPPTRPAGPPRVTRDALDTAKRYFHHLQTGDYDLAYALMSAESRRKHSSEQFERVAKEGEILYELDRARVEFSSEEEATVSLPHAEDPAWSEVRLVKEKGQWRVVFLNGLPWAPQP